MVSALPACSLLPSARPVAGQQVPPVTWYILELGVFKTQSTTMKNSQTIIKDTTSTTTESSRCLALIQLGSVFSLDVYSSVREHWQFRGAPSFYIQTSTKHHIFILQIMLRPLSYTAINDVLATRQKDQGSRMSLQATSSHVSTRSLVVYLSTAMASLLRWTTRLAR